MALPTIKRPTFTDTFPNSNTKYTYVPFDTAEQKCVLIAAQGDSDSESNLIENLVNMVDSCTFNKHDLRSKPVAWFERALLAVRSKSVGEVVEIGYRCLHEHADGTVCNHRNNMNVPFLEKTTFTDEKNPLIDVDETIKIKFKHVTMQDIIDGANVADDAEFLFKKVECVIDGEEIYSDFTLDEFRSWLGSVPPSATEKMEEFFSDYSHAELVIPTRCKKCGNTSEIKIVGAVNFFG